MDPETQPNGHRTLARGRTQLHDLRRDGAPRPAVLHDAVALDRHQDPPGDARRGHLGEGRLLMWANESLCIAPDVKLGKDVKLAKFINLYGCEIGDETKIGTFVEIQKNAKVGRRCKISSHT